MSDTPRTDAAELHYRDMESRDAPLYVVPASVCQQIERELAEAKAFIDRFVQGQGRRGLKEQIAHLATERNDMRAYSRRLLVAARRAVLALAHASEPGTQKDPRMYEAAYEDLSAALSENPAHECGEACPHASDCAVHNAPAYPAGECTCGAENPAQTEGMQHIATIVYGKDEDRVEWPGDAPPNVRAYAELSRSPGKGEEHIPAAHYSDLWDYHLGVSGEGPHAYTWKDKPHRLVYDLTCMVAQLRATRERSPLPAGRMDDWPAAGKPEVDPQSAADYELMVSGIARRVGDQSIASITIWNLRTGKTETLADRQTAEKTWFHQRRDASGWQPIETAPRDGTMLLLLIGPGEDREHALEDVYGPSRAVGHNNRDNDGEDRWQFAGWCWSHDHYTEGQGTPVAWQPFPRPERHRIGEKT